MNGRIASRSFLLTSAFLLFGCSEEPAAVTAPPTPTQAAAVPAIPTTGCGAKATFISEIQGDDEQSALVGRVVTVQAIVTFTPIKELGGLFIQEEREDRDGEPSTSEGLFLTTDAAKTAKPGDIVRATGTVSELGDAGNTLTSLTELSEFRVCGSGKLPSDASIEQAPLVVGDWERYEGMRVRLDLPVTVVRNDSLRRSGELLVSLNGRQYSPTQLFPPGEDARKLAEDNARSRIWLDDASLEQFPTKVSWLPSGLNHEAPFRLGTRLGEVGGVLDQRAGGYRIHLLQAPVVEQAARPKAPPIVEGSLKIASFNMLNWFNGDGKKGGFPTARGATNVADAERQRAKLVAAVMSIKPDIAGLMEVENDGDEKLNALNEFVNELNRQSGLGYAVVAPPEPKVGGDLIRVAIIYRSRVVQPKGVSAALTGPPFDNYNRVPLAQTFQQIKRGGVFTVIANHFKSKSCSGADEANVDRGDGQGCFNAKRVEAARTLLDWLKTDPTKSGDPDQLIIGDLNAYAKEDPIRLLVESGFMHLGEGTLESPHYSFSYDGTLGSLDHALASESLKAQVRSAEVWHINADEHTGFAYHSDIAEAAPGVAADAAAKKAEAQLRALLYRRNAFRSSDHDPLIIGLELEK